MKKFFPLIFITSFFLLSCEKSSELPKDISVEQSISNSDFSRPYGNTINNYINEGNKSNFSVAEYNDTFYYSTNNAPGLFKQSSTSPTSEKLNADVATHINIYKDKIYYKSDTSLIRVDLDGVSNKETLETSITELIISNDTLFYVTFAPSNDSGFSDFQLNKYNFKKDKLISSEYVATRLFSFIDENRHILGSRELFSYISINNERVFPLENEQNIITFLGETEDSLICRVNNFSKTFFFTS